MITQDRYGVRLPDLEVDLSRFQWSVRIADTGGNLTSTTAWTWYEIPGTAVVSRQRAGALDGLTWSLSLEVLEDALPELTAPLPYYQLEMDMVDEAGNRWPYFTGPIDSIAETQAVQGGAIVRTLTLEAFGTLQRAKDYNTAFWNFWGPVASWSTSLTAVCIRRYATFTTTGAIGWTGSIPGSWHTLEAGVDPYLEVSSVPGFGSKYVLGVDYTVTATDGLQLSITFGGAVAPAATLYARWVEPQYWGIPYSSAVSARWIVIPDGKANWYERPDRNVTDTFQTYAAAGSTTLTVNLQDPGAYTSGAGLVQGSVPSAPFTTDYLTWTLPDGTEETRAISSVSAGGAVTVSVAFSAAPADGDPIRVSSTELKRQFVPGNVTSIFGTADRIRFFTSSAGVTEYAFTSFQVVPELGRVVPLLGRHYTVAEGVYTTASFPIRYFSEDLSLGLGSNAKVESAFRNMCVNLVPSANFVVGNYSGAMYGGISAVNASLDKVISDLQAASLPGNAFLHDMTDGRIKISAYYQATAPALSLSGISSVEVEALPEPVTRVTVIAKGEEYNLAPSSGPRLSTGWTNAERLFDGSKATTATCTSGSTVTIPIPINPSTAASHLFKEIRVSGTVGLVVLAVQYRSTATGSILGVQYPGTGHYMPLNASAPTVFPASWWVENAVQQLAVFGPAGTALAEVVLTFYSDGVTAPVVSEIEMVTDTAAAWVASLTDDTTGSPPSGWSTVDVGQDTGSIWWQRDLTTRASYRFATTARMRRTLASYASTFTNQRHRMKVITMNGITADECRDMAELYLDEATRTAGTYRVQAVMDPRVDLGDTVAMTLADGSVKLAMVWGVTDGGGATETQAQFQLVDYSA